jgi:hypothetical protein
VVLADDLRVSGLHGRRGHQRRTERGLHQGADPRPQLPGDRDAPHARGTPGNVLVHSRVDVGRERAVHVGFFQFVELGAGYLFHDWASVAFGKFKVSGFQVHWLMADG